MLTYDDCLGLSMLGAEEIAAIAKHEHVPEIIALEMGSCLCETPEGKQLIQRMIFNDIEEACRRSDTRAAGKLGLVLHHFIETHLDRHGSAKPRGEADTIAPWIRERVDVYLTAMLRHFGVDRASAQERFRPEMQIAEVCCAACTETGHCGAFLAGHVG